MKDLGGEVDTADNVLNDPRLLQRVGPDNDPDRYVLVARRRCDHAGERWLAHDSRDGVEVEAILVSSSTLPEEPISHPALRASRARFLAQPPHGPRAAPAEARVPVVIADAAPGPTLHDWLTHGSFRSVSDCMAVVARLREALEVAPHGRLDPSRVVLTADGPIIIDHAGERARIDEQQARRADIEALELIEADLLSGAACGSVPADRPERRSIRPILVGAFGLVALGAMAVAAANLVMPEPEGPPPGLALVDDWVDDGYGAIDPES